MSKRVIDLRRPAVNEIAAAEIKAMNVSYVLDFVKHEVTDEYQFCLDDFDSDAERVKFCEAIDENTKRNDVEIVGIGKALYVKVTRAEPLFCVVNMIVL